VEKAILLPPSVPTSQQSVPPLTDTNRANKASG
jgi:hypothetical protein